MIVTEYPDDYRLSLGLVERLHWLEERIGPRLDSVVGFRPSGLFPEEYWATPEIWSYCTNEFQRLTGNTNVYEFIRVVKGVDWTLFKTQAGDAFENCTTKGAITIVFDYEPTELMFKLSFS